jgi:hypothetical protein
MAGAAMMDDHETLSSARNYLADALKELLKAEIMTAEDFYRSLTLASLAIEQLNDLLRQPNRDQA